MYPHVHGSIIITITKTWKQPTCPLMNEWVKELRYLYIMQYYSAIKMRKSDHL